MILKLLTGGIDLPRLASTVASLDLASSETNAALADHIVKAHERATAMENLIASRALAEDVDTLRLKLDRVGWEVERPTIGTISAVDLVPTLATEVAGLKTANVTLAATVAVLSAKVEALTAAKLSEVKARKAPAKK